MKFLAFKTLKARVHQQDAKSEQNGPRRILPLQTSSPLGPVSTSKSPMNRALLSPDEGIEGFSNYPFYKKKSLRNYYQSHKII